MFQFCWNAPISLCSRLFVYHHVLQAKLVDNFGSLLWDMSNQIVSNDDSNSILVKTVFFFYSTMKSATNVRRPVILVCVLASDKPLNTQSPISYNTGNYTTEKFCTFPKFRFLDSKCIIYFAGFLQKLRYCYVNVNSYI